MESHAEIGPDAGRDPVGLIIGQAATRVPELVPIRHGRMLVSPFTFYRGAALPMAADLSTVPSSGLRVQLCGDAHLSNFGVFAAPDRRLVFDLNDFDETLPGPFEWDVKRFAASLAVAGRDIGLDAKDRKTLVLAGVAAYRTSMAEFAEKTLLEVWYARLDVEEGLELLRSKVGEEALGRTRKAMAKARTRDSMQVLEKLTTVVDGQRRIISNPPLVVPVEELTDQRSADEVMSRMRDASSPVPTRRSVADRQHLVEQFRLVGVARKVVGVGSVGTRAWIMLLEADDGAGAAVPPGQGGAALGARRLLRGQRVPQRGPAGRRRPAPHAGRERHLPGLAAGQRPRRPQRDFYVRQLRDWKYSAASSRWCCRGSRPTPSCAGGPGPFPCPLR